jgi:hypothetical protein
MPACTPSVVAHIPRGQWARDYSPRFSGRWRCPSGRLSRISQVREPGERHALLHGTQLPLIPERTGFARADTFLRRTVYGLCAKAVNRNNLIRPGSTCTNGPSVRACLDNADYDSRAYGSHSDDAYYYNALTSFFDGRPDIDAAAATPSDTTGVCGQ